MIEISGLTLEIVKAVIIVAIALITYVLVPWIKTLKNVWYVGLAVKAAEFAYRAVAKAGPDKKNYVVEWLQKRGIHIDPKDLDVLIDSILLGLDKVGEGNESTN